MPPNKEAFKQTDRLIATTKGLIVKNKTRKAQFSSIGAPPIPIVTRWGSWLKAVDYYYYNNFPTIKEIIMGFESEGKIVIACQEAVQNTELEAELKVIKTCYMGLIGIIDDCINKKYNILEAYNILLEFDFKTDPIELKYYLDKRLMTHVIQNVFNNENKLDFILYNNLLVAQSSSIYVERSFSLLGNMLRENRNFDDNNIRDYMLSYYNENNSEELQLKLNGMDDTYN